MSSSSILSTSGINQMVYSFKSLQQQRQIYPLKNKINTYSNLSSTWSSLSTSLTSLQTAANTLKYTGTSSIFNSSSAALSDDSFFSVTASSNATPASYAIRVNQLAKSDLVVSDTMTSDTAVTTMAGTHKIKIQSGDYVSHVSLDLTASETNSSVMSAIADAINNDYAVVESDAKTATDTFTGSGTFVIDIDGTETSIDYDYSTGYTYDDVISDLVSKINSNVDGVTAEKVTDGSNVNLKITVDDKSQYVTMATADDTGTLLDAGNLNIDVTKEKSAANLASSSVFTPSTDNSKLSITAKNTGYDNRLIMSDESGSALDFVGLTSSILSNHTVTSDDTSAGFMYDTTSSTSNELNSVLDFNGISVQRSSNTITDLVSNLTFTLKAKMETTDTTVTATIGTDVDEIKSKVNDFISKFNDSYLYIKNRYYSGDTGRGIFAGDSTAYALLKKLQDTVIGKISGITDGNYSYLSEVGITFDPSTGLSLSDSSKFESALQNHPSQVEDLFNSTNGVATTIYDALDSYVGADGSIANVLNSLDNNVNYLNDRVDSIQSSIDKRAENLRKQYENLQQQLAQLLMSQQMYSQFGGGFF